MEQKFFQLKQKTHFSHIPAFAKFFIGKIGTKIKEKIKLFLEFHWKKSCTLFNVSHTAILLCDKIKEIYIYVKT